MTTVSFCGKSCTRSAHFALTRDSVCFFATAKSFRFLRKPSILCFVAFSSVENLQHQVYAVLATD